MCRSIAVTLLLITSLNRSAASQQPIASLAAGVGNAFGGVGLRGEVFVARGRMSVLTGAGILPGDFNRSHLAGAASLRYYAGRRQHRLFVDASWSLLARRGADCLGCRETFNYGPGVALGYTFMPTTGPTLTVGAGLGRDILYENDLGPVVQLGIGWTWWRRLAS
jgi:hypothetical protein